MGSNLILVLTCFSFLDDDDGRRVEKLEVLINCRKRSRGARIGDGIGSVGVEVEGVAAVICYSASIPTWTNMIAAASASDNGSYGRSGGRGSTGAR